MKLCIVKALSTITDKHWPLYLILAIVETGKYMYIRL